MTLTEIIKEAKTNSTTQTAIRTRVQKFTKDPKARNMEGKINQIR